MALTEISWHSTISRTQKKDITPSLNVRRCLFGPVDHETVRNDLRREMKSQSESSARKWNFDFEKNTPLEGRFLWSRMNTTPEKYSESKTTVCNTRISTESGLTTNTTKVLGCVKSSLKNTSKVRRDQSQSHRITDFLRAKKPYTRSDKYIKRLRAKSRPRQTCLDKFLE